MNSIASSSATFLIEIEIKNATFKSIAKHSWNILWHSNSNAANHIASWRSRRPKDRLMHRIKLKSKVAWHPHVQFNVPSEFIPKHSIHFGRRTWIFAIALCPNFGKKSAIGGRKHLNTYVITLNNGAIYTKYK